MVKGKTNAGDCTNVVAFVAGPPTAAAAWIATAICAHGLPVVDQFIVVLVPTEFEMAPPPPSFALAPRIQSFVGPAPSTGFVLSDPISVSYTHLTLPTI